VNEEDLIASLNGPYGLVPSAYQLTMSNYARMLFAQGLQPGQLSANNNNAEPGPVGPQLVVTRNPQVTVTLVFTLNFPT